MSNNENSSNLYIIDKDGNRLEHGYFGFVVMEFANEKEIFLDDRIENSNYYDTGHLGYKTKESDFLVYERRESLFPLIGLIIDSKNQNKIEKYLIHQFDYAQVYQHNQYSLVDDKVYGFKHIYPYPGEKYLKEYYSKFTSNPSLRNFNFDYHFSVLKRYTECSNLDGLEVLDVAAGDGSFLRRIKDAGANVVGFEPSNTETEEAEIKGVKLINEMFEPEGLEPEQKFDMVIAGNIFEHVPNPFDFMGKIKSVLKQDGFIFFQVPNDFNVFQLKYMELNDSSPWFVCPPEHLNYWDVEGARSFVKQCGFEVVHEEAQFPIEMFLLFGMDYRKQPELGKEAHTMRCNFEDAFSSDMNMLSLIYEKFIEAGIGRDYVAILRFVS